MSFLDSEPFLRWRCDECGETIGSPPDGWIEWRERDGVLFDFRIVHHVNASPRGATQGCYGQSVVGNMLLEETLGVDGLAWLLSLLGKAKVDQPQFAELVRRLHIPYYENARMHRVDPLMYETNGVREFTQAGILAKLRLAPAE